MERRRSRTLVIDSAYQSRCGGDWIPSVPSCFSVHRNDDNGDQESRLQYRSRPWSDRTTSHIHSLCRSGSLAELSSCREERGKNKKLCTQSANGFQIATAVKMGFYLNIYGRENLKPVEDSGDASLGRKQIVRMLVWSEGTKPSLHLQLSLLIGGLMCKWEAPPAPVRKITVSSQDAKETQSCRWFAAQESQTASRFSLVHFALWSCTVLAFLDSGILSPAAAWTGWYEAEWLEVSIIIYFMISLSLSWIQHSAWSWRTTVGFRWVDRALFIFPQLFAVISSRKVILVFNLRFMFPASGFFSLVLWCTVLMLEHNEFCLSGISKKNMFYKIYSEYLHTSIVIVPLKHKYKSKYIRTIVLTHVTSLHHVTPTLSHAHTRPLPPIDFHWATSTLSYIFSPHPSATAALSSKSPQAARHCVESPCRNDGCAVSRLLGLVI